MRVRDIAASRPRFLERNNDAGREVRKEGSGDPVVDGGMGSGRAVEAMEEWMLEGRGGRIARGWR